jgi:hypothetical protein
MGVQRLFVLKLSHRTDLKAQAAREFASAGFQSAQIQFFDRAWRF